MVIVHHVGTTSHLSSLTLESETAFWEANKSPPLTSELFLVTKDITHSQPFKVLNVKHHLTSENYVQIIQHNESNLTVV